ncbi:MAG: chemotaxis-specific protein-glutamate methyltransferase CheB [Lachnospiraceae bacterium]|nr:chemotaxis-specific protein-glutamate methyltransferase CheB [Lachnospiraceae bacterium]
MGKLKVLLVVGTFDMSRMLRRILETDADIEIAAEANNAYTARDKIIECEPDVMLLCHELPRMSGILFLRKLMPQRRIPTLMIAPPQNEEAAYHAGAKDFIACGEDIHTLEEEHICQRLKKLAGSGWITAGQRPVQKPDQRSGQKPLGFVKEPQGRPHIIAMGASTGGTEATAQVIRGLKRNIPGVVIVQHMPEGFTQMYAQRLDSEGEVTVKEAKSGDVVMPGQVLLAPGDKQMRIVKVNGVYQVECRHGSKVSGHCPSVDVLFESVARVAGQDAIGVLMTGMGSDGAKGLLAMRKAGARTIGQDEKSCIVYGMPKVAYELGAVEWQVPLDQIASKIYYLLDKGSKNK